MTYFRVLGPLAVERQGSDAVALNAPMVRRLLAALLSRANELIHADDLVWSLWGEDTPPSARKTLQVYVRRLRAALGDGSRIVHEPAGYRIKVGDDELDSLHFAQLVAAAARDGRTERAAALLREALGLWRGTAYEDVREHPPVADEARRLDEERLRIEAEHASLQLEFGRHAELIPHLLKLTDAHPYREDFRGHLMLALYRSGRQSEALEAFRGTRKLLAEELGVDPGPELQRLHEAILRGDPCLRSPVLEQVPRELPADIGGFVGRVEQIRTLDEMLPGPSPVVISAIAGTAGVGKTALAVHWARRVADRFPDGQLYLNLNGFSSTAPVQPIEALASMLRSIGVPPEKVPVEEAEAAAMFRTQMAQRRMLVLLDNARGADQVRPLLPGGSGSLVLITSRNKLSGLVAREGARRLSLDVLTPPEAEALLTQMLGAKRVAAEPGSVAALARACAYLPLALRIAAANLNDSPQRSISSHVEALLDGNRLASLEVEDDDQAAVRAAFDLSYLDIPEAIRRTFRLLGLIPGPDFTVEAVAALADLSPSDAQLHLIHLTNTHLIDQIAPDRFTFHDLLRLYAADCASAADGEPERASSIARLYDWYLDRVESAASLLYPNMIQLRTRHPVSIFDAPGEALEWLDLERTNLVAAIHHASTSGKTEAVWHLAGGMRGYFSRRRHLGDWLSVAFIGLNTATAAGDVRAQAFLHLMIAHAYQSRSDFPPSAEHLHNAINLAQETGWQELEATCVGNLGGIQYEAGRLEESDRLIRRSLDLSRGIGHWRAEGAAVANIGFIAIKLGHLARAVTVLNEAAEFNRQRGLSQIESAALTDAGEALRYLGRIDDASASLDRALRIKREIGDRVGEAYVLVELAKAHLDGGELDRAAALADAGLQLAQDVGNMSAEVTALAAKGSIRMAMDDLRNALADHKRAAEIASGFVGTHYCAAVAAAGLAAVWHRSHELDDALSEGRRALELARQSRFHVLEGRALTLLAKVENDRGSRHEGSLLARAALENHQETGCKLGELETHLQLADLETAVDSVAVHRQSARDVARYLASHGFDLWLHLKITLDSLG